MNENEKKQTVIICTTSQINYHNSIEINILYPKQINLLIWRH